MMRPFRSCVRFVVTCAALGWADFSRAQTLQTDNILERFPVAKNGDGLLLPVTIDGKKHLFVLDTGASSTVVDRALLSSTPRRRETIEDAAGKDVVVESFDTPQGSIGKFGLKESVKEVFAHDFSMLRKISDHEIRGFVGLDFLKNHVVHINIDRGEVVFLKKADPQSLGEAIPIDYNEARLPQIRIDVPGLGKSRFVIDTGLCGMGCGGTDEIRGRMMIEEGHFRTVGTSLFESISGIHRQPIIQGAEIKLGSFKVRNPQFDVGGANLLGLGFISRFNITFDFPNKRVYLQKSVNFERPDKRDRSGLHLLRDEKKAVRVHSVEKESPAQAAGIAAGDLIQMIGALDAKTSLFELRMALSEPEKTLSLVILRDGKLIRKSLALK
jgi:hypothetical protein